MSDDHSVRRIRGQNVRASDPVYLVRHIFKAAQREHAAAQLPRQSRELGCDIHITVIASPGRSHDRLAGNPGAVRRDRHIDGLAAIVCKVDHALVATGTGIGDRHLNASRLPRLRRVTRRVLEVPVLNDGLAAGITPNTPAKTVTDVHQRHSQRRWMRAEVRPLT